MCHLQSEQNVMRALPTHAPMEPVVKHCPIEITSVIVPQVIMDVTVNKSLMPAMVSLVLTQERVG